MVEQNILEPSTSPWGAPCLLVKKKTEHGLQVTPRLVDKLIKVEPWSAALEIRGGIRQLPT
jgi:hypothetical protein